MQPPLGSPSKYVYWLSLVKTTKFYIDRITGQVHFMDLVSRALVGLYCTHNIEVIQPLSTREARVPVPQ